MKLKNIVWRRMFLSIVFVTIWICGRSFEIDNTLSHICGTKMELLFSVFFLVAGVAITYSVATLLIKLGQQPQQKKYEDRRAFVIELTILTIIWGLYLIACYPGFMVVDSWWELNEFWGGEPFTTHHPPVHVLLLGVCSKVGMWLKNGNAGIFLMVLIQAGSVLLVETYLLYMLRKLCVPRWLYVATYVSLLSSPYFVAYFTTVLKDNLYACAVLLYMIELVNLFIERQKYWNSKRHVFLWIVANLGVYLMRNNGKYILIPMAIVLCFWREQRRKSIKGILLLFLPIILAGGIQKTVNITFRVENGSIREMLSLPFQQTARYVRDYPDDVTTEEKDAIDKVLYYDLIGYLYVPQSADKVKAMYKETAGKAELLDYFRVWLQMFFKHPDVYIKATLNQNFYLVDPLVQDDAYYNCFVIGGEYENLEKKLGVESVNYTPVLRKVTEWWKKTAFDIPLLRLLYNYGFYNVILFFLIQESLRKKEVKFIIVSVPLLLSDLIIVAAPLIYMSPRYAFPIIYAMPITIAFYMYINNSSNNQSCLV